MSQERLNIQATVEEDHKHVFKNVGGIFNWLTKRWHGVSKCLFCRKYIKEIIPYPLGDDNVGDDNKF